MKTKLLALIHACIENPAFYNEDSKTERIVFPWTSDGNFYTVHTRLDRKSVGGCYQEGDTSIDSYTKLKDSLEYKEHKFPFQHRKVEIKFGEEPKLLIELRKTKTTLKVVATHELLDIKAIKKFKNWALIRLLRGNAPLPVVTFEFVEVTNEWEVEVEFGSLKANISVEEYQEIVEKINANRIKHRIDGDTAALDARITKYSK